MPPYYEFECQECQGVFTSLIFPQEKNLQCKLCNAVAVGDERAVKFRKLISAPARMDRAWSGFAGTPHKSREEKPQ